MLGYSSSINNASWVYGVMQILFTIHFSKFAFVSWFSDLSLLHIFIMTVGTFIVGKNKNKW